MSRQTSLSSPVFALGKICGVAALRAPCQSCELRFQCLGTLEGPKDAHPKAFKPPSPKPQAWALGLGVFFFFFGGGGVSGGGGSRPSKVSKGGMKAGWVIPPKEESSHKGSSIPSTFIPPFQASYPIPARRPKPKGP